MTTYTVSSKITWAEVSMDEDPFLSEPRRAKIVEMTIADKTDGNFYTETDASNPDKPCFTRDFIDQAAAEEWITFSKELMVTLGWPDLIINTSVIPVPTRP